MKEKLILNGLDIGFDKCEVIDKYITDSIIEKAISKEVNLLDAPCGSGKTTNLLHYAVKHNLKVIFAVPLIAIKESLKGHKALESIKDNIMFVETGNDVNSGDFEAYNVFVVVYDSIAKLLRNKNNNYDLTIIDEADTFFKYKKISKTKSDRLTTFIMNQNKPRLGKILYMTGSSDSMIKDNSFFDNVTIVTKNKNKDLYINVIPKMVKGRKDKLVKNPVKALNTNFIVDTIEYQQKIKNFSILVFMDVKKCGIETLQEIKEKLEQKDIRCYIAHSKELDERGSKINHFQRIKEGIKKDFEVVISSPLLNVGVDFNNDFDYTFLFGTFDIGTIKQTLDRDRSKKNKMVLFVNEKESIELEFDKRPTAEFILDNDSHFGELVKSCNLSFKDYYKSVSGVEQEVIMLNAQKYHVDFVYRKQISGLGTKELIHLLSLKNINAYTTNAYNHIKARKDAKETSDNYLTFERLIESKEALNEVIEDYIFERETGLNISISALRKITKLLKVVEEIGLELTDENISKTYDLLMKNNINISQKTIRIKQKLKELLITNEVVILKSLKSYECYINKNGFLSDYRYKQLLASIKKNPYYKGFTNEMIEEDISQQNGYIYINGRLKYNDRQD